MGCTLGVVTTNLHFCHLCFWTCRVVPCPFGPPDLFRHPPEPNQGNLVGTTNGGTVVTWSWGFQLRPFRDPSFRCPETAPAIQRSSKGETCDGGSNVETDHLAQRKRLIEGIMFWEASKSMSKKVGHTTCLRGGITKLRDTLAMICPSKHQ